MEVAVLAHTVPLLVYEVNIILRHNSGIVMGSIMIFSISIQYQFVSDYLVVLQRLYLQQCLLGNYLTQLAP